MISPTTPAPRTTTDALTYHYLIVRRDLPVGLLAAQLAHAADESAVAYGGPLPKDMYVVVLAVPDEPAMREVEARLASRGVAHVAFHEPDLDGALTAVGVVPCPRDRVKRLLSRYPTLGATP